MNRKDRIAVVLLISLPVFTGTINTNYFFIPSLIVIGIYWSYRCVKNDISFLKVKDD